MRWGIQVLPEVLVVRLYGTVDQEIGSLFEKTADRAVYLGKRKVIIDFTGVESFEPLSDVLCGFGLDHLRRLGVPVAMLRPPASVFPILRKFGLEEIPSGFSSDQAENFRPQA